MCIGDKITAHDALGHRLDGLIVYGFCKQTYAFTDRRGAIVDEGEFIGIACDCPMADRVRLRPEAWAVDVWRGCSAMATAMDGSATGKQIARTPCRAIVV